MYIEMAEEEDKKMAESWKADADGILVFVRSCSPLPYFTASDLLRKKIIIYRLVCSRQPSRH